MSVPKRVNISPKAKELIKQIYINHAAGCCWHVVLDDENWDSIDFCKEYAMQHDDCETGGACQELAKLDVTASILSRARDKAFCEIREPFRC